MIIRANGKDTYVMSIISEKIKREGREYPALRFEFPDSISTEDIENLMSGTFDILDDEGNVLGTHEGYNTRGSLSVVIGKITPAEEEVQQLTKEVDALNKTVDDLLLEVLGV